MRITKTLAVSLLLLAGLFIASPASAMQKVFEKGDMSLKLGYLLQVQGTATQDSNATGDGWGTDFFVRRSRFLVGGAVSKNVTFFMETDHPNWGKNNDYGSTFFVQDAFVNFKLGDHFHIATGMLLVPFTHHFSQGATNLNTLDYHGALNKYHTGKVWRDMGFVVRGYFLDNALVMRLGVFNGVEGAPAKLNADGTTTAMLNESDLPRVSANIRYNIMGRETGMFLGGHYFATEPIISVGAAVDFQKDALQKTAPTLDAAGALADTGEAQNYMALGGDVFVEYPMGNGHSLTYQTNFVMYDHGEKAVKTGWGLLNEVSYRIEQIALVGVYDMFKSDAASSDYTQIQGGLNFFVVKHNASVKLAWLMTTIGDADATHGAVVQTQLYF
jgi:phosphate-selective porin O/P